MGLMRSLLKEALLFKDPNEGLKLGLTLAAGGGLGYLLRALIGDGNKKKNNEVMQQLQTVMNSPKELVESISNTPSVVDELKGMI